MKSFSDLITDPGDDDVVVKDVFTERMFTDLENLMISANWTGVKETKILWEKDYRNRKVISSFLRDNELGKKRLISMPDRVSNSINTVDGIMMRPSVINCYSGDLR
jgi:hypothetical protein